MLLAVLAAQQLALAALIWRAPVNRLANRYLAILLVVIAGMLTPFVLGYAGFYDAYPWLTSAPFAVPLAVGPLLYGHVYALAQSRSLGAIHFVPAAVQLAYQAALFPFPVATKYWWDSAVNEPMISPLLSFAVLVSMTAYAITSWRLLRRYEAWLADRRRDRRPARRVRLAALSLGVLLAGRSGYDLFDLLIRPIDYFDLFGFYVLLALAGVVLGANGWRNAAAGAPTIAEPASRDWTAQGETWLAELRAAEWWRDPDLDLPGLARRLGTNTSHLSRALNEGHGGFAAALGAIRAEAVAEALARGWHEDLLSLALATGFGSKASFNRAFRDRFAMSPTEYRTRRGVNA